MKSAESFIAGCFCGMFLTLMLFAAYRFFDDAKVICRPYVGADTTVKFPPCFYIDKVEYTISPTQAVVNATFYKKWSGGN